MSKMISHCDQCYEENKPGVADTALNQSTKEGFSENQFLLAYGWYAGSSQVNLFGKSSILGIEIVKVPRNSLSSSKKQMPSRVK